MPDQHCPVCGTVRTAGSCGCSSDFTDTAVLPHIEGPPLVRPYVPQARGRVGAEPGPAAGYDPFGAPPAADYRTALMPPVPLAPPPRGPESHPYPADPATPGELGLFAFDNAPTAPQDAPPGGRAARRADRQSPTARRRGAVLAAGAGVVVLGVGAAFLVTPSGSPEHKALPTPTAVLSPTVIAPSDPPSTAVPSPSATSGESVAPSASAPRTARPTSKAPAPAPTTEAPAAPAPTAVAPTPTATTPSPSPSPSATVRILERDMKGDDVKTMQQLLVTESCGRVDKSLISGTFDYWTEFVLKSFQDSRKSSLKSESGRYGPRTKAALETAPPNC
ncbi:hypothetical protein [Kitasatospora sp. NPDC057015]|uniref:peptidoglycan-binding domain-containing protein n=1 Tax=Kitasatospora sp. NPDC057015 TaxID=3346001 RepID=UPI00362C97B2